jgi:oxygen-independent coproporphyrinogen III oxidase
MMNPQEIFDTGLMYHHYANTAYPLTPMSFREYRVGEPERIVSVLRKEWEKADEVCLYVHIPFCSVRCKFCEYTVLPEWSEAAENEYVDLLLREIALYAPLLKGKPIVGFDLGGGTPTKISVDNVRRITETLTDTFEFQDGVVFSIETTPVIAAKEPEKLKSLFKLGYTRMSMGIQTVSEKLLNELGREGATLIYEQAVRHVRDSGCKRLNLDLMYGFLHQANEEFESTLRYAISLQPEYITLYRNRYKGTKIEQEAPGVSLYKIISQYRLAYRVLKECGYDANPGKNTFSKVPGDYGTSDYLTRRVIEGTPYLGMGLGAQSFGVDYLAYNEGAASKRLERYREKIMNGDFPIQDIYCLPKSESIAKMVSVAFYFGFIDREAFQRRFKLDFASAFKEEIAYVLQKELMEWQGSRLCLTSRGADYINGIIPLFFSERSKVELKALAEAAENGEESEKVYLSAYNMDDYPRPSVATDMVILRRSACKEKLSPVTSVLLIRRGEHPCMGKWALPGGFVRPGESVEQTAARELKEETGLEDITLRPIGLFSKPGRDPRGWIISCAFTGEWAADGAAPVYGDDAIDARWFEVSGATPENLTLRNGDLALIADDLAFDHADILCKALE